MDQFDNYEYLFGHFIVIQLVKRAPLMELRGA
jgi:hypothetical protein